MRNFNKILGAALVFTSSSALSVSLETVRDGYTMDWSSSRLKFEVSAKSEDENGQLSYLEVEKKAWASGLSEVRRISEDAFAKHYAELAGEGSEAVNKAGLRAARNVFSKNTEYVSDGSVNLFLEARLSNVLSPLAINHVVKEKPDYKALEGTTGVVFKLSCEMEPRANLKIENSDGDVLYAPELISETAYSEVLSGRWYRKPSKWEIRRAAGNEAKEIAVTCLEDGRLVADNDAWEAVEDAARNVIVQAARVAIVVP